jgi:hypothetical protein
VAEATLIAPMIARGPSGSASPAAVSARDPLMHPIQLAPNQIRHYALNEPARILSVPLKYQASAKPQS